MKIVEDFYLDGDPCITYKKQYKRYIKSINIYYNTIGGELK